jgi:endoglucanase
MGIRKLTTGHAAVLLAALIVLSSADAAARPARAATATAVVRVNQVGYPATATKRAYLMSSVDESGATFAVKSGATTVYSAAIGARLGSWSRSFPNVYALDFPTTATGSYTIAVTGPVAATSTAFPINSGSSVYGGALANSLAYYQNSRDGAGFVPSPLRTAGGHLNDSQAMTYLTPNANSSGRFSGDLSPLGQTVDASGGWWDAGDYLKFVQTESYTDGVLLSGVRDFPTQMGAGGGADFTAEARFGADFLLRMWDDSTRTLYYQVGIGSGNAKTVGDHDIWRLPQADDTFGGSDPVYRYIRNRPVFRAGAPGSLISPNLAGRDAAALAECYQVFRVSDPAFAARCLTAAEHIFALANTAPSGNLLTVIPFSFYPESEWRDDLEWGATELYLATDSATYLQQAAHWANAYITGPEDAADTLNLYDASGLAHYDLYRAITQAGNPGGLEVTQAALLADLKKQLDGAVAQGATDPFGFGFPWAAFDTTSHGFGLAVMASEYDQLTGTTTYAANGTRWIGNVLGANAWGVSLAVGDGTTYPHCMQHQVANLAGSLDGSAPILAGAVVEGPNKVVSKGLVSGMRPCPANGVDVFAAFNSTATFSDNVQSWSTDEPAIDLSATSPLAFARQAAGLY